jgi:hypothetical protein
VAAGGLSWWIAPADQFYAEARRRVLDHQFKPDDRISGDGPAMHQWRPPIKQRRPLAGEEWE